MSLLQIDLLKYSENLKIREKSGKKEIFDPVRRRYVNFTQEEFVRQLFVRYLMVEKNISRGRIAIEKKIKTGKLKKRFDLLLYDTKGIPLLIVEFKSPELKINQDILNQAGLYNKEIMAPFLAISNGRISLFFKIDFEKKTYKTIEGYPSEIF